MGFGEVGNFSKNFQKTYNEIDFFMLLLKNNIFSRGLFNENGGNTG